MSKPALSSRLLGLKFMQRSKEKEEKKVAEVAAEERDAEASKPLPCSLSCWVVLSGFPASPLDVCHYYHGFVYRCPRRMLLTVGPALVPSSGCRHTGWWRARAHAAW